MWVFHYIIVLRAWVSALVTVSPGWLFTLLARHLPAQPNIPRHSVYLVHFCIRETGTVPLINPPHKVSLAPAHLKTIEKPFWHLNSLCPRCHITEHTDVKTTDRHSSAYPFAAYFFFQCSCFVSGNDTLWNLLLVLGFPTCANTENAKIILPKGCHFLLLPL